MSTSKLPPPTRIGILNETWPPKPSWIVPDDVPDLSGQIFLVTGGNTGIGKETCRILLAHNAKVYLAARSAEKARSAIDDICKSTGKADAYFIQVDLADLASVRRAAEEYLSKEQELHVLINNGGVMHSKSIGGLTAQQYDEQFGTNVLGHYFLTTLLLPVLLRTARGELSGVPRKVRVVTISSNGHELAAPKEGIVWQTLQKGDDAFAARKKVGTRLYGQSKLGNVLVSSELARKYGDQGVVAISLHPGSIRTELMRNTPRLLAWILNKTIVFPISYGVITPLYAATSEEALEMNGEYLTSWARRKMPSKHGQDAELARKVWKWCEDQVVGY